VSVVSSAESLLGATRLPIDCSARPVTAADRRGDVGVGEVELGLAHARLRHLHRGARLARGRSGLVGFLLADGAPVGEALQPLGLLLRELVARERLGERAARLLQLDLEGCALDAEERRAGLHRVALAVELALEDAGDARAHLHFARALGAPDRLEADRHAARRDLEQRHAERLGLDAPSGLLGAVLRSAGRARRDQNASKNGNRFMARTPSGSSRRCAPCGAPPLSRAADAEEPLQPVVPTSMPRKISAASSGRRGAARPAVMARRGTRRAARPARRRRRRTSRGRAPGKRGTSGTTVRSVAMPCAPSTRLAVGARDAHQAGAQVARAGVELDQHALRQVSRHLLEKLVLAGKMLVHRLLGHARAARDLVHARAVAAREERAGGGAQHALAVDLGHAVL
jgi:hypothetical protein